jgi:hypothetical protein
VDAKVLNFDAPMRFLTQRDFQVGIWVRNGMHVGTQLPFGGFRRCFSRRLVASQSARVPACQRECNQDKKGCSRGGNGVWSPRNGQKPVEVLCANPLS